MRPGTALRLTVLDKYFKNIISNDVVLDLGCYDGEILRGLP